MSRTTASIMRINQELDKISGLDGLAVDKIEALEKQIKIMVSDILENHAEANIFDYEGYPDTVTPKETFDLELTTGYKTKFIKGKIYKLNIDKAYELNVANSTCYVKDSNDYDIPFIKEDLKESFDFLERI